MDSDVFELKAYRMSKKHISYLNSINKNNHSEALRTVIENDIKSKKMDLFFSRIISIAIILLLISIWIRVML